MKISTYLNPKFICTEMQATTKEEAIKELVEVMKESPAIKDFDQFLKDIFEREEMMSTGIGHNVALPHARTEAVDSLIIGLGRSYKGIDFDAIDKQPVNLIFLMGTPKKDMSNYLKGLAYLTRMLTKEEFRGKLLEAKTAEDIINIFKEVENK